MQGITLFRFSIAAMVLAMFAIPSFAQQPAPPPLPETQPGNAPAPPSDVKAIDLPNDAGGGLIVSWTVSPDDTPDAKPRKVVKYEILRMKLGEQTFQFVDEKPYQSTSFEDINCELGESYFYQIVAVAPDGLKSAPAETAEPAETVMQYFDESKAWFGVLLVIVCGSVVYYIEVVKSGKELKIRKIAGLEAIDEAVGRATEMGRSCLFVPGIQDINDIQTIAGITILSHVAGVAAEYGAKLEVPTARSLVMTVARQTVEAAYLAAGRHDAYNEDDIYYLTDEQFGYVAGVTGMMVREKPAACFSFGAFYAESLILAEMGNSIGAIQVAGTAMPSQLPFFVAACDYTLIGEEFFAASAYLSGEPHQLGSLKGQDVGKAIGTLLLLAGCILATILQFTQKNESVGAAFSFLKDNILGSKGFLP